MLLIWSQPVFAQKDTLTREQTRALMSQINIDTIRILREHGEKACKCLDSLKLKNKDTKQISTEIAECIDKETFLYQSILEANRSMKNGNLNTSST
jgi:hypothetical protein